MPSRRIPYFRVSSGIRKLIFGTVPLFALFALSSLELSGQCPAVNDDTNCGTLITITDKGATVTATGQGPYDGNDDTLVGVINNSSFPVSSIQLTSTNNIFSFDGDGLTFYGIPGNSYDSTGYGGPNAYYTNVNGAQTTGTVNFIVAISAKGGTGYFGLENALSSATACSSVINNAVTQSATGAQISASFTPNFAYTLADSAKLCGFIEWDWQSTVTYFPSPSPYWYEAGSTTPATYPHNDPPLNGYAVNPPGVMPNAVKLPVYYNLFTAASDPLSLLFNETPAGNPTTLSFYDAPGDPCLPGGLTSVRQYLVNHGWAPASCLTGVPATAPKPYETFTTHLVGIQGMLPGAAVVDTGIGFDWKTTYNGTTGHITVLSTALPPDPGSGTGGVTITNTNGITTYVYPPSVSVGEVNGKPVPSNPPAILLDGDHIQTTASGLAYSRATQSFTGTIQIKNITTQVLNGPFEVLLNSLTSGVTLMNATGRFGGSPYITIPGASSLAPGATAVVEVQFKNPSFEEINFNPVPYSGAF